MFYIILIQASKGDRDPIFYNCHRECLRTNCSGNGVAFKSSYALKQSFFEKLLDWNCDDECKYNCMWKTVSLQKDSAVMQFYGKWPFVRFLGIQEPASTVFSFMNLLSHLYLLKKFRKNVSSDSPCYIIWHIFAAFCLNGWFFSTMFHARDKPATEFLDYISAYSIVLVTLYCMVIRFIHNRSAIYKQMISVVFLCHYLGYIANILNGDFSYHANMNTNIITGLLSAIGWLSWYVFNRRKSYSKKIVLFYVMIGMSFIFEFFDFPPILWTFDAHSFWHLSSIPINFVIYSFAISDCQALRIEKIKTERVLIKKEN